MSTLEQDYTTVPGQLYACLSVVGPEAPQKNDKFGIKIRGAFNSRDEAASHAKRLQKEDATFDIYVVDMYKWLLIPPDPTKIEDVHYTNEKLEELMSGYKENQAQAAQMFAERKRDMVESASTFTKPGDENSKYYTKPDEPPISHPAEVLERLQKEKPDTPMEELVKEADATVAKEIEERKEKREADATAALEKEASEKGFNSVEAMQKFENEKENSESSTEAQDTKGEGEVEEGEEVESK
ncbi:hypothetical protein BpV1_068c [Bathycoccus sp. RCC1105 virus BpV1]|uniref:hypothetical protein n=1 Tax=Bathycoccus sp. RCC1105 virus BpV1 TaxID=880159 RepID=UPI0001EF43C6|nr:hypothetical protein BpV1_068c [Bathycoccus sp. RCC1105 virus BpV1]ADQ91695.1 hypothetical protein BpV1_068c [Bathycoccus sp. RCC1105 virus BpV1]